MDQPNIRDTQFLPNQEVEDSSEKAVMIKDMICIKALIKFEQQLVVVKKGKKDEANITTVNDDTNKERVAEYNSVSSLTRKALVACLLVLAKEVFSIQES